jgi:hypothetical protein
MTDNVAEDVKALETEETQLAESMGGYGLSQSAKDPAGSAPSSPFRAPRHTQFKSF